METLATKQLIRSVGAAASSLTLLLLGQGCLGIVAHEFAPGSLPLAGRGSGLSILLSALAGFAWLRAHREPVLAATVVAGLLGLELAGAVVLIGVPDLPTLLQVTFVVLVYGGLGFLMVAAVCAARQLGATAEVSPGPPPGQVRIVSTSRRRVA